MRLMLLRFVWWVLRPAKLQGRGAKSLLVAWREALYKAFIERLARSYRHYAVYDTISINGGKVKVVHTLRDLQFEGELKRVGIPLTAKMVRTEMPLMAARDGSRLFRRFFKFEDTLSLEINGKHFSLERDKGVECATNMRGTVAVADAKAAIARTSFVFTIAGKSAPKPSINISAPQHEIAVQPQPKPAPDLTPKRPTTKPKFEPLPTPPSTPTPTPAPQPAPVEVETPQPPKSYSGLDEVDESF